MMKRPPSSVASAFEIDGACRGMEPLGRGHIHRTFQVEASRSRYILQQINTHVFPDVAALMHNVARVSRHLRDIPEVETFDVVPTRSGEPFLRDAQGRYWRMLTFVEHTCCHDTVPGPKCAADAAALFARFQQALMDLPPPPLQTLLPDFHHTPRRFDRFLNAQTEAPPGRRKDARAEIDFALERGPTLCRVLQDLLDTGEIPLRVAHNDTKINNVLFDHRTGAARAVIDLDTVMPGLWLHDVGDLIRTAATKAAEDERDLSRVRIDPALLEAILCGYRDAMGEVLLPIERRSLITAGCVICFETGLRFLTDYLLGDRYFAVQRPGQNLDRCRTQFRLALELFTLPVGNCE